MQRNVVHYLWFFMRIKEYFSPRWLNVICPANYRTCFFVTVNNYLPILKYGDLISYSYLLFSSLSGAVSRWCGFRPETKPERSLLCVHITREDWACWTLFWMVCDMYLWARFSTFVSCFKMYCNTIPHPLG